MKKIVSFEKELEFPSMIGEIISISLDHTIEFTDSTTAEGEFIVLGTYKMTEASTLVEDFNYHIPVEINLTENLDIDSCKISISDFNYEIVNDDILKCNIDLLLEGTEQIILEEEKKSEELVRECDGDIQDNQKEEIETLEIENNEISMPEAEEIIINSNETIEEKESDTVEENLNSNISSLFQAFENAEETFTTYSVYIMRKEDTLEKIIDTYHISREQLSEYNDLNNLEIGSKVIIPNCNE